MSGKKNRASSLDAGLCCLGLAGKTLRTFLSALILCVAKWHIILNGFGKGVLYCMAASDVLACMPNREEFRSKHRKVFLDDSFIWRYIPPSGRNQNLLFWGVVEGGSFSNQVQNLARVTFVSTLFYRPYLGCLWERCSGNTKEV